ncbi:retrovirus-related pol polyprotein from transposon TNT 1-94 [Tanacetum coccineum]
MSSIAKFDVEKFDGSNDFGLWRVKMRCLLIQHGWEAALDPFPKTMADAEKTAALKTDVYKKATVPYSCKKLSKHINEFNKLIGNLANIDVDIDDEDQALMLLTSLQSSYDNFVETLLYGRESLTLEDVLSDHRDNQGRGSSRSKSKGKGTYKLKCYICYSEDHLKKDCPKKNKKKSTGFVKKNARQGSSMNFEDYLIDGVLLGDNRACAIMRKGMKDGSSFMLENVHYILELKRNLIYLGTLDRKGYTVKLHNRRVKMIKGSLMVLSGTMKGNYVYSLDGWVDSGKASVGIQEKESLAQGEFWSRSAHDRGSYRLCPCGSLWSFSGGIDEWLLQVQVVEAVGGKAGRIARHLTVAGTPQQNGLAERMNMTLLNKVFIYSIGEEDTYGFMGKLKHRAIKSIFLGYPDGVKGYKLWRLDDVKPKIIIIKDVVFNESLMYKDTLKGARAADSGNEVEFKVEHQGSRIELTVDPHTGENPWNKDKEQDEGPQQQNLNNYVLVCDRAKRITFIHARYRDESNVSLSRPSGSRVKDDMAAYTFAIIEEKDTHEPITFQEAINSSEKDEWVRAMEEEMSSLKKNHTWELVDQPPGQKLVSCKWLYKIKEGIKGVQKPRVILSLTACEDYELEQLDVKTAFLHANLEETIYMMQPLVLQDGQGQQSVVLT